MSVHGWNFCGACGSKYPTYNMYGMGTCENCGFDNKPHTRNEPQRAYEYAQSHQIVREPAIVREVVGEPERDEEREGIDVAIAAVFYAHEELSEATTLGRQAVAMNHLDDAVADLISWHPRFDINSGRIEEPCEN